MPAGPNVALHAGFPAAADRRGEASGPPSYPLLFSPFRLGNLVLPNRIVMAPMSSSLADTNGFVTPELIAFLRERAIGGTGMVVVEFTCVDSRHGLGELRQPRLDLDAHVAGHAELVKAITTAGARACLQLHLPGQYVVRGKPDAPLPIAPSDVFSPDGRQLARALGAAEIEELVQRYADASRRAVRAGYQAIEVHGAHGYLPMAFMSPRKNQRDDAWGGDFERRLAFPLAVVRAIREVLAQGQPLVYRLSAAEFAQTGLRLEDMERIAPRLAAAGCTMLHVSTGTVENALDKIVDPMSSEMGWRFPLARRLREASGLPVMAVGPVRWPASAEQALAIGDVDLIALGRPLLADPHWARKARAGSLADITPCTSCNWCMDRVRQHASIGCAENPRTGREAARDDPVRPGEGTVAVVVGGGPGGLQAAMDLDALGYRTHLFEARPSLGGGLDVSAAPPFKDPLAWYRDHLRHRLAGSGVTVHMGRAAAGTDVVALKPALVVIATGSRPKAWRDQWDRARLPLLDATEVLLGDADIGSDAGPVIVYGGGETGCETAEFLAAQGREVKLVTRSRTNDLARAAEAMYRRQLRTRLQQNRRVEIVASATLQSAEGRTICFSVDGGETRTIHAAAFVMAQGREPVRALAAELEAAGIAHAVIGDAESIGRIGDAVHAAYRAVRALARGGGAADQRATPA